MLKRTLVMLVLVGWNGVTSDGMGSGLSIDLIVAMGVRSIPNGP